MLHHSICRQMQSIPEQFMDAFSRLKIQSHLWSKQSYNFQWKADCWYWWFTNLNTVWCLPIKTINFQKKEVHFSVPVFGKMSCFIREWIQLFDIGMHKLQYCTCSMEAKFGALIQDNPLSVQLSGVNGKKCRNVSMVTDFNVKINLFDDELEC